MDSRGHGHSSNNGQAYSYELMAKDVIGLLDHLKINKTAIVGWSDGANIGLVLAMQHPERLTGLFAYGGNSDYRQVHEGADQIPTFKAYVGRVKNEYQQQSSTPEKFKQFSAGIFKLWETQPSFTKEQLKRISIPVWIVDGDHEEGIMRTNTEFMAEQIPGAGLLILPWVSHFAFLQNPSQFNDEVFHFLTAINYGH